MAHLHRFSHRFRFLKLLRATLFLGALYDAVFAVLMVAAPGFLGRAFDLPLPPRFYLWLLAVLLLMLAALYVEAARDPRRYSAIIRIAIAGRLLGAVALGSAALLEPGAAGLWQAAAADAFFGVSHLACWIPSQG